MKSLFSSSLLSVISVINGVSMKQLSFAIIQTRKDETRVSFELPFVIPVINGVSGKLVKSLAAELKVATCSTKFHTEKTTWA